MKIRGHAAVFDSQSENLGGFVEIIAPGAFTESLAQDDVVLLNGHDSRQPLARMSAGNLTLREDDKGLFFEADLPDTSGGRDLHRLVADGVLRSMSFGFTIEQAADESFKEGCNGLLIRRLRRIRLMEISPVTWPAYPASTVSAAGDTIRAARSAPAPRKAKAVPIGQARAKRLREKLEASQRSCIIYGLR